MKMILRDYTDYFKNISKNVLLYLGIILFATIVTAAYNILFGIYMKNVGYTEEFVGRILSLKTIGVAIGAVPVAIISERINKKWTLIAGLFVMLGSSLMILNVNFSWTMELFAIIFGLGNATVMVLQAPIIYDNTEAEHRVTAFSMAFVFQNIAFVIGSFALGHLSEFLSGIYGAASANLMVLNGATLLVGIAILIALRFNGDQMTSVNHDNTVFEALGKVLTGYRLLLKGDTFMYLLQVALVGVGAGMIVPFFSMYLKYSLNIADGSVGTIMAISQVGTVFGGLIVPPLAKRMGRVNTVIACQLLSIPFLISISFPQGIIIITISFFFRSSLMNMASPVINSLAMEITSDDSRTFMSSMIMLINNLFRSIGIYIGGYLMFKYSYNTPYYWTILAYLIGTFILYRVFKRKNRLA
ncbi:MFS family permease [Fusibacter tunisiensis]|uniref:MFS family permease n=2 Tax=Fusibacter tunisiensis TaxID=1008308 RepID=A0ABS2MSI1_9FIRM|nr:MFS family permease [Fusibacter tunisiensis]